MLDRIRLISEIERNVHWLFAQETLPVAHILKEWALLSNDENFLQKIINFSDSPWPVPLWNGPINDVIAIETGEKTYCIISVDGSQVYPDRHIKSSCFLLNIGIVIFEYKSEASSVIFEAIPLVYPLSTNGEDNSIGTINGIRHEQELAYGFAKAKTKKHEKGRHWLLFDGSFIFWHLDLQRGLREKFLHTYLSYLQEGYTHQIPTAAYISDPKSKELISILRLFLCDFAVEKNHLYASVDNLVDAFLVKLYVPIGYRTTIFQNRSPISHLYPGPLKPHFFYINLGQEIGRVEFPAWMACEPGLINALASCIKDQAEKGGGYPVALAEAHEQAVIKSADRDFFYRCLEHIGQKYEPNYATKMQVSQKLLHKRLMKI
ncbi:MAG TPA: DNA double-strand break repair nuclease NurA [Patescibacteria group bacterium]|nr:DNA double-strand break repair nuclease NurA [Patescibacteria group bacterium]